MFHWKFTLKAHDVVRTHPNWRTRTTLLYFAEMQWGKTGADWVGGNGTSIQLAFCGLAISLSQRFTN